MSDYEIENCRSCEAPVIWAMTERGKLMPVDAEPSKDGNVQLKPRVAVAPLAEVLSVAKCFGKTQLRLSHFVKCPQAKQWRTPRGK